MKKAAPKGRSFKGQSGMTKAQAGTGHIDGTQDKANRQAKFTRYGDAMCPPVVIAAAAVTAGAVAQNVQANRANNAREAAARKAKKEARRARSRADLATRDKRRRAGLAAAAGGEGTGYLQRTSASFSPRSFFRGA